MKKIFALLFLFLAVPHKMDAALTPNQFNTVKNYLLKAIALQIKAQELMQFTNMAVAHADPSSPLNQSVTLNGLNTAFGPTYNQLVADVQTALNDMPQVP